MILQRATRETKVCQTFASEEPSGAMEKKSKHMIKFFRRIRQNLLMENKTGQYLKYAIGEIILVVIGIINCTAAKCLERRDSGQRSVKGVYEFNV